MRRIIEWSVDHPLSVGVLLFVFSIIGVYSLRRIRIDLFPDISSPTITIITAYPGASPKEVLENITKPLEKSLRNLPGLKEISSRSIEEYSQIRLKFQRNYDISEAYINVVDRVRGVKLPEGALKPSIIKFDPSVFPVMTITFPEDKAELVKSLWVNRASTIYGVAIVPMLRTYEEYIGVKLKPERLAFFGIRPSEIFGAIYEKRYSFPLKKGEITNRITSLYELRNMIVGRYGYRPVFLYEVADISYHREYYEVLQLNNGIPAIISPVFKTPGANTFEITRKLKRILEDIKKDGRLNYWIAMDQGFLIEKVIKEVVNTAILGGILAMCIIVLFTRSLRLSTVILFSIPISLSISFVMIDFLGYSFNAMTLAGIALAMGMIVDNSVIVSENIYRYISEGKEPKESSKIATYEVVRPIIASTLTTIIVFIPIVYLSGAVGEIAKNVGVSFAFALLSTLFVSITITPAFAPYVLKGVKESGIFLEKIYARILTKLRSSNIKFLLLIPLLPGFLIFRISGEFLPVLDSDFIFLDIELPANTPFEKTALYMKNVSRILSKIKEIENYTVFVSAPKDVPKGIIAYGGGITETYKGQAFIRLKERKRRKLSQWEIEDVIRNNLPMFPGMKVRFLPVERLTLFGMRGKSVSITFVGKDINTLENIARTFAKKLESIKGLTNITIDLPPLKHMIKFRIKEDAKISGISTSDVQKDILLMFSGLSANYINGKPIKILYDGDVGILPIVGRNTVLYSYDFLEGDTIKIRSVINRYMGMPSITVSADRRSNDLLRITMEIRSLLESYRFPEGYTYFLSGEMYELMDMIKQIVLVGILAVILIVAVMVVQFESLKEPMFIGISLIFSFCGSLLFLYIFGVSLSIVSLLGLLISFGVVVNNGIVMLNISKKYGIVNAARIRLRPILITNLTTLFGLLPMIVIRSEGFEYRQPIAVALFGGMIWGLIYSLFVLPSIYPEGYPQRYGREHRE